MQVLGNLDAWEKIKELRNQYSVDEEFYEYLTQCIPLISAIHLTICRLDEVDMAHVLSIMEGECCPYSRYEFNLRDYTQGIEGDLNYILVIIVNHEGNYPVDIPNFTEYWEDLPSMVIKNASKYSFLDSDDWHPNHLTVESALTFLEAHDIVCESRADYSMKARMEANDAKSKAKFDQALKDYEGFDVSFLS